MYTGFPDLAFKQKLRHHFLATVLKGSLRTADAFPVVASLPPKNSYYK